MNRRYFYTAGHDGGTRASDGRRSVNAETIRTGMIGTGLRGQHTLGQLDETAGRYDRGALRPETGPAGQGRFHHGAGQPQNISRISQAVWIEKGPGCGIHRHALRSAFEMAIAALKAGKNVYCEKPVGITPKQVRQVLETPLALRKTSIRSDSRCVPSVAGGRHRKVHDGVAGEIMMVKAQRHAS